MVVAHVVAGVVAAQKMKAEPLRRLERLAVVLCQLDHGLHPGVENRFGPADELLMQAASQSRHAGVDAKAVELNHWVTLQTDHLRTDRSLTLCQVATAVHVWRGLEFSPQRCRLFAAVADPNLSRVLRRRVLEQVAELSEAWEVEQVVREEEVEVEVAGEPSPL